MIEDTESSSLPATSYYISTWCCNSCMTLSSSSRLEACTYLHFFITSPASFDTSVEGLRFLRSLIRFLSRFCALPRPDRR